MGARFGQHFLCDANIINHIITQFNPTGPIIEIGPGRGALTNHLLRKKLPLWVIEIDREYQSYWQQQIPQHPQLTVISSDVLELDWSQFNSWHHDSFQIISNLPYEISGPFLVRLAQQKFNWSNALIMLQQEMVQKVIAVPGKHAYGRLSVQLQRHCHLQPGRVIAATAFKPAPKVVSQLLSLQPRLEKITVPNEAVWDEMLRLAFCHRRQMLRRIFKEYSIPWTDIMISETSRPENLTVSDWGLLSYALHDAGFKVAIL